MGPHPPLPPGSPIAPPAAWRSTPPSDARPVAAEWWRTFGDPILDATVERALGHNADLAQAVARVAQAQAAEHLARAQRGPELDFSNEGGRTRELEVIGPVAANGDKAAADLSWDFDVFRKLAQADAAARATLLASAATRDSVRLTIATSTASSYVTLLGLDARLKVARDTLASRAQSLHFARRRADAGYTSVLELRQAEGEYEATARLVPQAELAVAQQEDALSELIGEAPRLIARVPGGLNALTPPATPFILPSELLDRRPDIVAAEDRVVAADHSLSAARRAMLPTIGLSANYAETVANLLPTSIPTYLFASTVMAPIFDSGRRRAVARRVAAERDEAAFAFRSTVLDAYREVEDGLAATSRLTEVRRAVDAQVDAQQKLVDAADHRFRAGYSPDFEQIDARRQLLAAQLDQAQIRTDQLKSLIDLCKALGGGWTAPPGYGDAQGDAVRRRLVFPLIPSPPV